HHELALLSSQFAPRAGRQVLQVEPADAGADEAQGWVANGSGHTADLPVFALDEFEAEPASGNGFAKANRRIARSNLGLGFQQPCAARQSLATLNNQAFD